MEVFSRAGEILDNADLRAERFYELMRVGIARKAKADLFFLAKFVLGRDNLIAHPNAFDHHHRMLADFLMRSWMTRNNRGINTTCKIMMPRGTFKSTFVSEAFPIWVLLNWPETTILLESETIQKPHGHLYVIKQHFEKEYFRYLFGTLYNPTERWNSEMLQVKRRIDNKQPSISCGAVDVAQTGNHFDLIIPDDLAGKTNSENRTQVMKVIQHANQYNSLMHQHKRCMVAFTGTRWAFDDIMDSLDKYNAKAHKEMREYPVQVFEFSCWKKGKDGKEIKWQMDERGGDTNVEFPQVLPLNILKDLRAKLTSFEFSAQYELNPISNEDASFKKEWMQYLPNHRTDFNGNIYIAFDPAGEDNKYGNADSSAIVVMGITSQYDLHVLETIQGHWTRAEIADKLYVLNDEYRPKKICLETVFAQKDLYLYLQELSRTRGYLPLDKFKTSNQEKHHRIMALQPYVQRGKFFLRTNGRDAELEDQMIRYPKSPHVDLLDAAAYCLEFILVPREEQEATWWKRERWAENFVPTAKHPALPTNHDVRAWNHVSKHKDALRARGMLPAHSGGGIASVFAEDRASEHTTERVR